MNYTQLKQTIIDYTENTDSEFEANIDEFVRIAEQRIYNSVLIPNLRRNVTGSVTTNNKYLSVPLDFLYTYSLALVDDNGAYHYLINKDVNFIRDAYPTPRLQGSQSIMHTLTMTLLY